MFNKWKDQLNEKFKKKPAEDGGLQPEASDIVSN